MSIPQPPGGQPPPPPGGFSGGYQQPYQPPVEHPQGTTILVLGIISLVCCALTGPFAWVMGNRARRDVQAAPGRYSNSGSITAGWVCGIIGTVLLGLSIVYLVIVLSVGI